MKSVLYNKGRSAVIKLIMAVLSLLIILYAVVCVVELMGNKQTPLEKIYNRIVMRDYLDYISDNTSSNNISVSFISVCTGKENTSVKIEFHSSDNITFEEANELLNLTNQYLKYDQNNRMNTSSFEIRLYEDDNPNVVFRAESIANVSVSLSDILLCYSIVPDDATDLYVVDDALVVRVYDGEGMSQDQIELLYECYPNAEIIR